MSQRVDKEAMACNKPRRTPGHPDKSHVVKACYDGKEKIIRFGEQGASTAGKPKVGESERTTKKRASFKARHAKNIAKGPSSAAYWANKVKWAQGGAVELRGMLDKYSEGGSVKNEYSDLIATLTGGAKPSAPVTQDSPTIRSLKQARPQRRRKVEPTAGDYARSVGSSVTSLPGAPKASFEFGQRLGTALPGMINAGIDYFRRSSPGDVAGDVGSALKNVAGYVADNPVSTVADFIPFVGEAKQYAETIQDAARRRALGDLAGAYNLEVGAIPLAAASLIPGIGEVRGVAKAAGVADTAVDTARAGTRTMKRAASFPVDYGRPKGNLNLRPNIDPVTLKGAEVQDVESLINQLKGRPGVTKQGLERVAAQFEPGERVTKAKFGERLPPSEYGTVDLNRLGDVDEHLMIEARDRVSQNPSEVFGRLAEDLGLSYDDRYNLEDIIHDGVRFADEGLIDHLRSELGADSGHQIQQILTDMYKDRFHDVVSDTAERLREFTDDLDGYTYRGYQRLVKDPQKPGYFEVGVTHPERGSRYTHYPDSENVVSHFRGSFNPEELLSGYTARADQQVVDELHGISAKPNSMVIEEIQSDAQKGVPQTGVLHQPHATAFKAAIQYALEGGADTVYLPTAKTIAIPRGMEPKDFRSIYDDEIVKYGLNPLLDIAGVTVTPIDDLYHEINFTPEAKQRILRGAGQKTPGYAGGGLVSSYDEAKVSDLADQIRGGIYG